MSRGRGRGKMGEKGEKDDRAKKRKAGEDG
jgi:hypothetical protein